MPLAHLRLSFRQPRIEGIQPGDVWSHAQHAYECLGRAYAHQRRILRGQAPIGVTVPRKPQAATPLRSWPSSPGRRVASRTNVTRGATNRLGERDIGRSAGLRGGRGDGLTTV